MMIRSRLICSRVIGACVALAVLIATLCASGVPADAWMPARLTCDFDANGRSDIAVGACSETVSGHADAGLVHVTYVTKDWWLTQTLATPSSISNPRT